jgi:hypothetical protein
VAVHRDAGLRTSFGEPAMARDDRSNARPLGPKASLADEDESGGFDGTEDAASRMLVSSGWYHA